MKKVRLDKFLSEKGLSLSWEKAGREILSGWVKVNGETVRTASRLVAESDAVTVERPGGLFVSRGGEKLDHALKRFDISLEGMVAADLGSSTGGFTDCMLRAGASRVYAVDVGYGQLDYSLRSDPRVVVMERTHVRDLSPELFTDTVDFVTADLSFISLEKVFDKIRGLFAPASGVALIKPQFEAGHGEHKKGVVRSPEVHVRILIRVIEALRGRGMILKGLCSSPLKGPAGNIEFLAWFALLPSGEAPAPLPETVPDTVKETVREAHDFFASQGSASECNIMSPEKNIC